MLWLAVILLYVFYLHLSLICVCICVSLCTCIRVCVQVYFVALVDPRHYQGSSRSLGAGSSGSEELMESRAWSWFLLSPVIGFGLGGEMAASERLRSLGVNEMCGARAEHTHTHRLVLCCSAEPKYKNCCVLFFTPI